MTILRIENIELLQYILYTMIVQCIVGNAFICIVLHLYYSSSVTPGLEASLPTVSYGPNSTVRQASSAVELRHNQDLGRHLVVCLFPTLEQDMSLIVDGCKSSHSWWQKPMYKKFCVGLWLWCQSWDWECSKQRLCVLKLIHRYVLNSDISLCIFEKY